MKAMSRVSALLVHILCAVQLASTGEIGDWGEWSPCSRSCGPAISSQERNCLSGSCDSYARVQFRSCPYKPCDEEVDLRVELCKSLNSGNQSFLPHNSEGECLLACQSTTPDGHVTVRGALQALPGTRCTTATGGRGMCVNSLCTPVGCDGILGSRARIDKCGRCTAGEQRCSKTSGTRSLDPSIGQVEMIVLPRGASSISITNNLPPRVASLMVRSMEGEYFFTAGKVGQRFTSRGAEFQYSVEVENDGGLRERLTSRRTLNQSVIIEVYIPRKMVAPSITYEYYTVGSGQRSTKRPFFSNMGNYSWVYGPFLPCNQTCSSGVQVAYSLCKDLDLKEERLLPDSFCSSNKPLPIIRHCGSGTCTPRSAATPTVLSVSLLSCPTRGGSRHLCLLSPQEGGALVTVVTTLSFQASQRPIIRISNFPLSISWGGPRWVTREWLPCSQTHCGVGSQERTVSCMMPEASGRERMVADQDCNATTKPDYVRQCVIPDSDGCDTHWEVDPWGKCCSTESLVRRVECVDSNHIPQPPFLCSHLQRNDSLQSCTGGPCSNGGCLWVPKRWLSCNNTCGGGWQKRTVKCRNSNNKMAPSHCCQDHPLPQLHRECYDDRAQWCRPEWVTDSWNQCRGECGKNGGERTRRVDCRAAHRHGMNVIFPRSFCSDQIQPTTIENCTRHDPACSNCHWVPSNWSNCDCLYGARTRNVSCSGEIPDCCSRRQLQKPTQIESCNCTSNETTPTPSSDCSDFEGVNCQQEKEAGSCSDSSSDFARLLCCRTCSSFTR